MPGPDLDFFNDGKLDLHLALNPQKPLPVEARINRQSIDHQLRFGNEELTALMTGGKQGIAAIRLVLSKGLRLVPSKLDKIARQIADAPSTKASSAVVARSAEHAGQPHEVRPNAAGHVQGRRLA